MDVPPRMDIAFELDFAIVIGCMLITEIKNGSDSYLRAGWRAR